MFIHFDGFFVANRCRGKLLLALHASCHNLLVFTLLQRFDDNAPSWLITRHLSLFEPLHCYLVFNSTASSQELKTMENNSYQDILNFTPCPGPPFRTRMLCFHRSELGCCVSQKCSVKHPISELRFWRYIQGFHLRTPLVTFSIGKGH